MVLLSDRLFEPRSRLQWLHCELSPTSPHAVRAKPRHLPPPTPPYNRISFLVVVFVYYPCMCWRGGAPWDRTALGCWGHGLSFPPAPHSGWKHAQLTEQGCAQPVVLCAVECIVRLPPKGAKSHSTAQCAAEFCLHQRAEFPGPSSAIYCYCCQCWVAFLRVWLQPTSLQSLMWARAAGILSYTAFLLMSLSAN